MTLKQETIDKIRLLYDTTACSQQRIADHCGVSYSTVVRYVDNRSIKPSPEVPDSMRWSGKSNSGEGRAK